MTRMKGRPGWAPPHNEEHDEDRDCRPTESDPLTYWCHPVSAERRGYDLVPEPPSVNGGPAYDPPPSHYEGNGIMPWDVIQAWGLDYWLGNVLKYVCRAGKKDIATRLDDLKKARNFINKAIELEEGK